MEPCLGHSRLPDRDRLIVRGAGTADGPHHAESRVLLFVRLSRGAVEMHMDF